MATSKRIITLKDQKTGATQSIKCDMTIYDIFHILFEYGKSNPDSKVEFAATPQKGGEYYAR